MQNLVRFIWMSIALALGTTSALAQSACKYITPDAVLTNSQWNWCFQQKNDGLGFTPLNSSGGVMTGKLITAPSSTSLSGFNVPPGVTALSPKDGDIWTTASGLYVQINGATIGPLNSKVSPANPTAVAGPNAINGSAPTFMRSDAAPSVQLGTNAAQGIVRGDGTTFTCTAGVCSAIAGNFPTPTRTGDVIYWNGSAWVSLAGNNSGTGILAENSTGTPSWFKAASTQSGVIGNINMNTTSQLMAGLGSSCSITPTLTGRIRFTINFTQSIAANTTGTYQLRYGTGTAPATNAALAGTTLGGLAQTTITTSGFSSAFSSNGIVSGLAPGTAYWFDLSASTSGAGAITITQASCNANEF